ncbi:hypothetical protein L211DRAFT_851263 [Terfezia boudieri ATCC MYA-4762]|uniref:Uncharacterized protein n=1 Tax=Terfezia boudieri ATCC MYA-4762 TaxID=1051890 RepID=A0A3N4LM99_9PEZI|nr:hypothetical protein L211DRAFT_851263 [Terfezia boudieri ATCC MYA-4762]
MFAAQKLVLEHLRRVNNSINGEKQKEKKTITGHYFLRLTKTEPFKYATWVALKQSPEPPGENYLYQIIFELVKAGLLMVKPHILNEPIGTSPLSLKEIENSQFGANGERGKVSLNTGIITKIIERPMEKFSPFLTNLLQHNDVATLEGNIYEYVWSRRTLVSGWTPDLARSTLREKGVCVIPMSEENMKEATDKCHGLLMEKAVYMGCFDLKKDDGDTPGIS